MQEYCVSILREKDVPGLAIPGERQIKVALLAFEGKSVGEIRSAFPEVSTTIIYKALRAVRDSIRRGKAPVEIRQAFPELVKEYQGSVEDSPKKQSATSRALASLTTSLAKVEFKSFGEYIKMVKEKFAPIGVPLTIQAILDGVDRQDPEMIKLSTQVFEMTPKKGGLSLNQQFNLPGAKPTERTNPERRATYFEALVRKSRAQIDAANPAESAVEAELVTGSDEE